MFYARAYEFCPWVKKEVYSYAINKYKYSDQMHTQSQIKNRCTLMLLTNLAKPEWVPIKCDQRIIGDIMCMVPRNVNTNTNISLNGDLVIFEKQCISITGKCYLFSWGFLNDRSVLTHTNSKVSKFCHGIPCNSYKCRISSFSFPFQFNKILYNFKKMDITVYCRTT